MNRTRKGSARWVVASLLAVLMAVGALGSIVGWWTHRVLFDSDKWVEVVGPIGNDPVLQGVLSTKVSDELIDWIAPTDRLEELLPDSLAPMAGILGGRIERAVEVETTSFFQSPAYQRIWIQLNRSVHAAIVALIRDQLPFASTEGGAISIDLQPLVEPILDDLVMELNAFAAELPPVIASQLDIPGTIEDLVAAYETEGFPEDLNNIVIYESESLGAVQTAVAVFDRYVVILPILTIVLAAAAVLIAPKRGWMLVIILGLLVIAWGGALLLVGDTTQTLRQGVADDDLALVAGSVLEEVTASLTSTLIIVTVLAGALFLAAGIGALVMRNGGSEE